MARQFLLTLLATLSVTGQAQSWCPPGAKWTFGYDSFMSSYSGVERVEYVGDTMVGGQLAQRLLQTEVVAPWGTSTYTATSYSSLYTYHDNGVVYLWNEIDAYDTLMWFSALPGQRWNAPGNSGMYLEVLDTATVFLEGIALKRLVVQGDLEWLTDTLYERIGFMDLFLAGSTWGATDMPWTGLICYQDDSLSFISSVSTDCGFTLTVPERSDGTALLPYPDPGVDHFSLSLTHGPHNITLFDAVGRVVLKDQGSGPLVRIDTAHLPSGVYLVKVDDGPQLSRWVKE